jgi:hypothetical protein
MNSEYNNFLLVDRMMLRRNEWAETLEGFDPSLKNDYVKWEDKSEKVFWRGA